MSMDGLLDRNVGRDQGDPSARPGGVYGTATGAPSGGRIRVTIPALGRGYQTDPLRYVAPAGAPAAGDECLVVYDDRGNAWALFAGSP